MPPPSTVPCEMCHQQFSARSLAIHQRACAKKREDGTDFCPTCDALVSNIEYGAHVRECRTLHSAMLAGRSADIRGNGAKKRSKIPESVVRRLQGAARGESVVERLVQRTGELCCACVMTRAAVACELCDSLYCIQCAVSVHAMLRPRVHATVELPLAEKDLPAEEPRHLAGLAPCSVCSRRFAANRLGTHVIICARLAARAAAPSRKAYPTTMQTRLAGTDFFAYHPSALPRSTTETAAAVDSHVGAASQQSMHTKRPRDVCASNDATATQSIAQPRSVYHTGTSKAVLPPQTLSQGATWREQRAQLRRGLGLDAAHALKVAKAAMQVNSEYGLAPPDPPWLHATRIGDSVEICGRDGLVGVMQFRGPVWGRGRGTWLGIEFISAAHGDSDGTSSGIRYFNSLDGHALFVRPGDVWPCALLPNASSSFVEVQTLGNARSLNPSAATSRGKPQPMPHAKVGPVHIAAARQSCESGTARSGLGSRTHLHDTSSRPLLTTCSRKSPETGPLNGILRAATECAVVVRPSLTGLQLPGSSTERNTRATKNASFTGRQSAPTSNLGAASVSRNTVRGDSTLASPTWPHARPIKTTVSREPVIAPTRDSILSTAAQSRTMASSPTHNATPVVEHHSARQRDINRSVNYLRALASDAAQLTVAPTTRSGGIASMTYVAFAGVAHQVGAGGQSVRVARGRAAAIVAHDSTSAQLKNVKAPHAARGVAAAIDQCAARRMRADAAVARMASPALES